LAEIFKLTHSRERDLHKAIQASQNTTVVVEIYDKSAFFGVETKMVLQGGKVVRRNRPGVIAVSAERYFCDSEQMIP